MSEMQNYKHGKKPHAIIFPLFAQGHINPCVHLALKLASKGFTITFVHFEHVHHLISKSSNPHSATNNKDPSSKSDIFSKARDSGLDIRYTTISDGFPLDFDRYQNLDEYWEYMLRDFPAQVENFVGKIIKASDPSWVHFLVADTFFAWPAAVAKKYNLVNVSFWTQPATIFAIQYHIELLRKNDHFPPRDNQEHIISYIPGVETISTKDMMSYLQEDETTVIHKLVFTAFDEAPKADFILCNTVQELESDTLSALNQKHPTYAIGPISFSPDFTKTSVSKSLLSETDCNEWLDSKPPGSVLYVSLGSVVQTSDGVMEEIAHGLLLSDVNFIWVVRPDMASSIKMPIEFEDDCVKDRGLIVPWCNQNDVLSNSATGGFLTHCGWNSILESMWFGVPMICYPVLYDQPTNRKLVVDDWKIGINLCEEGSVTREEVAMKIKRLMRGETSDGIRDEIKKVSSIMHNALTREDGSSNSNFDQFVQDLRDKIHAKN